MAQWTEEVSVLQKDSEKVEDLVCVKGKVMVLKRDWNLVGNLVGT